MKERLLYSILPFLKNKSDSQALKKAEYIKLVKAARTNFHIDMDHLRRALLEAQSLQHARRLLLMDLYEQVARDSFVAGKMQTRTLNVLNTPFKVQSRDDKDFTPLFETEWFFYLLEEAMQAVFFGYSLFEFHFDDQGQVKKVVSIDRRHYDPLRRLIFPDPSKNESLPLAGPLEWLYLTFEVGDTLGLLLRAAPFAILKKYSYTFWARYQELFGIPMRIGKYSGNDERLIDALEQNLKEMGAAAYGVFPASADIELVETNKSDAYNTYLACIRQANEEISQALLGTNANQDSTGSYAREKINYTRENDLLWADYRRIEFFVNNKLLPFLSQHGYPQDLRFKFDPAWTLPLAGSQLEIDRFLAEQFELPEDYIEKTYGVPVKKKPASAQLSSASAQLSSANAQLSSASAQLSSANAPFSSANAQLSSAGSLPFEIDPGLLEELIQAVYDNTLEQKDVFAGLPLSIQQILLEALEDIAFDADLAEYYHAQAYNVFAFSAAKSFYELRLLQSLAQTETGSLKPFTEFRAEALKMFELYNEDYLRTEYDALKRGITMGARWFEIERNKDLYPYLRYETAGDDRVRKEHRLLEGTILPVDSRFWDYAYPPNGWNCRCSVSPLREDQLSPKQKEQAHSLDYMRQKARFFKESTHEYWRKNVAKSAVLTAENTVYFAALPDKQKQMTAAHYYMKPLKDIYRRRLKRKLPAYDENRFLEFVEQFFEKNKSDDNARKALLQLNINNYQAALSFDKGYFVKHMQERSRQAVAQALEDVLKNPDEVWMSQENGKVSLHFFAFYRQTPVVVNFEYREGGFVFKTLFNDTRQNLESFEKRRRGLLLFRKVQKKIKEKEKE